MSLDDYYNANQIIPVNQQDFNSKNFYLRRINLMHDLGIIYSFISEKSICVFGPGLGQNEKLLIKLNPKELYLVDNSELAIKSLKSTFNFSNVKILNQKIETFDEDIKFDLCWAEGILSHNFEPKVLFSKILSCLKLGGLGVVTTVNSIGWFSDIIRRIIFRLEFEKNYPNNQVTVLDFYSTQLNYLKNKTRNTEDYLKDNIVQDFDGRELFDFKTLYEFSDKFIFYKSAPLFYLDFQWYKNKLIEYSHNENRLESYYKSNLNYISDKITPKFSSFQFGKELEKCCDEIWNLHKLIKSDEDDISSIIDKLYELATFYKDEPFVLNSILEIISYFSKKIGLNDLRYFNSFWGRGQQYHSFLKIKYEELDNFIIANYD